MSAKKNYSACILAIICIIVCIVLGFVLKANGEEQMHKWFDVRLAYYYAIVIGPVICLIIGLALGIIIKGFAKVTAPRPVFRIALGATIVWAVTFALLLCDFLSTSNFIFGTVGPQGANFLLSYGRFCFMLLGFLCILLRPEKKTLITTRT